jgi:hypothetical protein
MLSRTAAVRAALGLLILTLEPGCHAIHRAIVPALPASGASEQARVELRVVPDEQLLRRDRDVEKLLRSMTVTPKAISDLAAKFADTGEGAAKPSERDLERLQRAHAELVTVNSALDQIDARSLPFRDRGKDEPHADHSRARSAFYACFGLTDPYARHPQLSAFEPSNGVHRTEPITARGIVENHGRHGVEYVTLNSTDLTRKPKGVKRPRVHARVLELRRSFTGADGEALALRMLFRIDTDRWGNALQLVPAYLRVERSYVRVAGLGATPRLAARGWLYPWMWLHGLAELGRPELTSISLDAHVRIESVSAADDEVQLLPLGEARFLVENLNLRDFPIERTCGDTKAGIPELPSPYFALPRTRETLRTPINVSVVVHEGRTRSGHHGWRWHRAQPASTDPIAVPAFDAARTNETE